MPERYLNNRIVQMLNRYFHFLVVHLRNTAN